MFHNSIVALRQHFISTIKWGPRSIWIIFYLASFVGIMLSLSLLGLQISKLGRRKIIIIKNRN